MQDQLHAARMQLAAELAVLDNAPPQADLFAAAP